MQKLCNAGSGHIHIVITYYHHFKLQMVGSSVCPLGCRFTKFHVETNQTAKTETACVANKYIVQNKVFF